MRKDVRTFAIECSTAAGNPGPALVEEEVELVARTLGDHLDAIDRDRLTIRSCDVGHRAHHSQLVTGRV